MDVGQWKEPEPEPAEPTLEDASALVNTWRGEGGGHGNGLSSHPAASTNLPAVSFISCSPQNGGGKPDAIKHLH